ncbi:MAG TPA: hypothetical protein VGW14_07860 [Thermoleophilaceae bacterium]|nr:hypothetical protein [Thermoleophilaceae bacterium]
MAELAPDVPPIACTLDPAQMRERGDLIRALGRDGLQALERGERRVTLRFRPDPAIRERVEGIVAAESRCCAFLDFSLADEEDATVLTIAAPEGAEPVMHGLADLFSAQSSGARG